MLDLFTMSLRMEANGVTPIPPPTSTATSYWYQSWWPSPYGPSRNNYNENRSHKNKIICIRTRRACCRLSDHGILVEFLTINLLMQIWLIFLLLLGYTLYIVGIFKDKIRRWYYSTVMQGVNFFLLNNIPDVSPKTNLKPVANTIHNPHHCLKSNLKPIFLSLFWPYLYEARGRCLVIKKEYVPLEEDVRARR